MKNLILTTTHIKILETIGNLNKRNLYPLSDGVYKIVAGVIDPETRHYIDEPTFGTLISFTSKKVCRYLLALQRHKYIKKVYCPAKDCLVYATTESGEQALFNYHRKHKTYVRKTRKVPETIIKL